ncbi:MAG: response regulator [Janthinobacterium lividum]
MIRLFLVDDHSIVRNGLRAILAAEADLVVVGEASHGQELFEHLPAAPADVVLLDAKMPGLDGPATTARLCAEYPALRVLVLTMAADAPSIGQLFAAGARGYLLKSAGRNELLASIRAVAAGELYLCSELGLSLLHQVLAPAAHGPSANALAGRRTHRLTTRELEVLQLLAAGLTTNEIAAKLFTSKRTVETHRQHILEKTQTRNTASLIHRAVTEGLLD